MPAVKITNKPVSTPGDQTHFLVTQPELPEGYTPTGQETEEELAELKVESLREIEMGDMVELIQSKLAFDSEPTAESNKPVTSAGIKAALDAADAEIDELKENITNLSTATASDVGKALKAKTVTNGKVTEWEFGEVGGADPSVIEQAVDDWLDTHPEATTTVQDGSITKAKIANGVLNYVTPEMFGAKADGTTDDTSAFTQAIAIGLPVKLMANKQYSLTGLEFTKSTAIDGCGAELLVTGKHYPGQGSVTLIAVTPGTKIAIRNTRFTSRANHALFGYIEGIDSLIISGCSFDGNSWENGAPVTYDGAPSYHNDYARGASSGFSIFHTTNIAFVDNVLKACWQMGLYIDYCKYGVIRNNSFEWFARGAIYLRHENEHFVIDKNTIQNVVRYYTVNDGCIDLYGPDNAHIRITNNYIKGYGTEVKPANAITMCGGYDLYVGCNTFIADDTTYAQSLVMIEQRTDSGVPHPSEGVIVENNDLINDNAIEFSYHIRSMENYTVADGPKNINISILNNRMTGRASIAEIEMRHAIDNLFIEGNIFGRLMIDADDRPDYIHNNIHIVNNIATRLRVRRSHGVIINGNSVNTDGRLTNGAPIILEDCANVTLNNNRILTFVSSWLTDARNIMLNIGEDNIVTDTERTYFTKAEQHLVKTYEGIDISASGYLAGSYVPLLSVYGNESSQEATPSLAENYDYIPMNSEGDMTVTVVTNGITTVLSDSTPKYAIPMSLESYANCVDAEGNYWKGDYRDWANGVDVHVMRCYTLTGEESYYEFEEGVYVFENVLRPYAGVGLSTHDTEDFVFTTNFDDNTASIYDRPMYFSNNIGESLVLRTGWFGESSTITDVMALFAEKYQSGTPFKIWYEVKTPYTTPIPAQELAAYNAIVIGSTATIETSNDCYLKAQFFKNDEYGSLITSYAYSKPYIDAALAEQGYENESFRTIKTISISEETGKIFVNTDDNGINFALSELVVYFNDIVAAGSGNGCISVNSGQTITGASVPYIACENMCSTTAKSSVAHLRIAGGRFFGEASTQALAADYATSYTKTSKNALGILTCTAITEFCIASLNNHKFTSGMITIYGR